MPTKLDVTCDQASFLCFVSGRHDTKKKKGRLLIAG